MENRCPSPGLLLHQRCWHLSAESASCAVACFAHGLNFSWYLTKPNETVLSLFLSQEAPEEEHAWARLECYNAKRNRIFSAKFHADEDAWDTHRDPRHWSYPGCSLACPCSLTPLNVLQTETLQVLQAASLGVPEPNLCALPKPRLLYCCLRAPQLCWYGNHMHIRRNYRRCCMAVQSNGCPSFSVPMLFVSDVKSPLARDSIQTEAEVCVHHDTIAHDIVEDRFERGGEAHECDILQILTTYLLLDKSTSVQVVDVGTNIGTCALALASLGANVVGFEPHPRTFSMLNASVRKLDFKRGEQRLGQFRALNVAIGDHHFLDWLAEPYGNAGGSYRTGSIISGNYRKHVEAERVLLWPIETQSLDTALSALSVDRVDILKVDAEGDEIRVLHGAFQLLSDRSRQPRFAKIEFFPFRLQYRGEHPVDLLVGLIHCGYALLVLTSPSAHSFDGACWLNDVRAAVKFVSNFTAQTDFAGTDILAISLERVVWSSSAFKAAMRMLYSEDQAVSIDCR